MRRTAITVRISLVAFLFTLCGCGSGGGGNETPASPQAVVTLSTKVTEGGTVGPNQIHGIQATLILPAGVTVKYKSDNHEAGSDAWETADKVVVASGEATGASIQMGSYTPATATTKGSVKILIVKTSGFGPGEFVTINCDRNSGVFPGPNDFQVTDFEAVECDDVQNCGAEIVNLTYAPPAVTNR